MNYRFINRSVIGIIGNDRLCFLQSLLTNDVSAVNGCDSVYSFLLSPQGRILYDFFIFSTGSEILLDCQAQYLDKIIDKLNLYKLRSDVEIINYSNKYSVYYNDEMSQCLDPRNRALGSRYIKEIGGDDTVLEGQLLLSYHHKRMKLLIPDSDLDLSYGEILPLDVSGDNLNAISFTKGCYVGQEVTARMNWKAMRKKKLICLNCIDSTLMIEKNSAIEVSNINIGYILGKVGDLCLALVKEDALSKIAINNCNEIRANLGLFKIVSQ